jgi:hypothetical protein
VRERADEPTSRRADEPTFLDCQPANYKVRQNAFEKFATECQQAVAELVMS